MLTASVVIPVKDGARYLHEVLEAVKAQAPDEVLVIDSGSRDGSVEIARAAGAQVIEIAPAEFGHGRTRNLGAERTTGEVICFLTQDATPVPGWLAALREGFELSPKVGAVYGPHLPRPDTSPMIARELTEFFATHSPSGEPVVQYGEPVFLSNVNAAYRRECWEAIRFDDVPYAEDQGFAVAMFAAGWTKAYHPEAAVLHAHDYPPGKFMRRYFDEYRGLRGSIGHVERIGVRSTVRHVRESVAGDRRWMREHGIEGAEALRWTGRAAVHHGGRKIFSALGSRAERLPAPVQRRLSLEGTVVSPGDVPPVSNEPPPVMQNPRPSVWDPMLRVARDGPARLRDALPGQDGRESLHLAVVIPPFRRGSGGHNSIFQMLSRLEQKGHTVSVWVHDPLGWQSSEWPAVVRRNISEYFAPFEGPVFKGFDRWYGADVVVATGWDTVHPALLLDDVLARVYLVHDHEPEFHATSAQRWWAEQTYSFGLHTICASPWLSDIVRDRYGGTASNFDFGVDHDVYHPRDVQRRRDTVIFYGRDVTPRRAVPLGLLALQELHERRPDVRLVMFGDSQRVDAPFPYEHIGIASPDELAREFSEATVGLVLSMTNYSLIPQEMLACGLPCVDLAGFSAETVFGADGPVELAPFSPVALADAMERLLDDRGLWERRAAAGREFVAGRTWDRAAEQVEAGIREALRLRELEFGAHEADDAGLPVRPPGLAYGAAPPPGVDASARSVPAVLFGTTPVTDRLLARLSPEDLEAIGEAVDENELRAWEEASPPEQRMRALHQGVWHRVPAVLEKTGLTPDEPPEWVHAMARGPLAAGGDHYSADFVVEALGGELEGVRRGLDFGCSSGRTLRSLSAAWPEVEWFGVDPNADAVAWAAKHVPAVAFSASPTDPPLEFGDGHFDLVYAISIWSHFNEAAALRWLDEMHRVIAGDGRLVMTFHGMRSIEHAAQLATRTPRQLEEIRRAMYRRGFWFAAEFGDKGDHGVVHTEWGNSYMTPEWLLRHVAGRWSVDWFAVGRNSGNQDVITLRRR